MDLFSLFIYTGGAILFLVLICVDEKKRRRAAAEPAAALPMSTPASAPSRSVPLPREPMNNNNNVSSTSAAASSSGVKAITFWSSIYQIMNTGGDQKDTDCVICLCKLQHGERIAGLECCKHLYHQTCLAGWLERNLSCPLCRSPVRALWPRCSTDIV